MALKLGTCKAYDRIEWPFLNQVLLHMGFPHHFREVIMRCVKYVSFSAMINESLGKEFKPQRGLKQGDPLSPYLFIILCADSLLVGISKAVQSGALHDIRICPRAPIISYIFFVDGSLIFGKATEIEAAHLVQILRKYEEASHQRINFNKSELSFSRNVPTIRRN